MTTLEMLEKVIANEINDEVVAKATEMKEKHLARNEKRRATPSKSAKENAPIHKAILDIVASAEKPMTSDEIAKALDNDELTLAKIRGILGNMGRNGVLVKGLETGVAKSKAKTTYSVVTD